MEILFLVFSLLLFAYCMISTIRDALNGNLFLALWGAAMSLIMFVLAAKAVIDLT